MNNSSRKKQFGMNIGSASILLVFVILCLVSFAVLSIVSANADSKLSARVLERTTAYYAACNQAEEQIASLDAAGELKHMTESLSFQVQISDRQALFVELSPDGTDGYVISAWQTISTGDWNSTSGSPGIGISNED